MKVIVVGAGIYGMCVAHELVSNGHSVTVLDQYDIPNRLCSSYDHHRLIRYPYGTQTEYAKRVPEAFEAWNRLWASLGRSHFIRTGSLSVGRRNGAWFSASLSGLETLGVPYRNITAPECREKYPWLEIGPNEIAFETAGCGILQAGKILESLDVLLRTKGVVFEAGQRITSFSFDDPSVTTHEGFTYQSDLVVFATGAWHSHLFPSEIQPIKQTYALHKDVPGFAHIENGCPIVMDLADDHGFYFVPASDQFPAKYGNHSAHMIGDPTLDREVTREEQQEMRSLLNTRIPDGLGESEKFGSCYYAMTKTETMALVRTGSVYRLYGGSGNSFKFGPLFSQYLADVIDGRLELGRAQRLISGVQ